MMVDIKNFYLNMPMEWYEYVHIKLTDVPNKIIKQYKLAEKVNLDGYFYIKVQKGMYGLPQAGILAQQLLEKCLNAHR